MGSGVAEPDTRVLGIVYTFGILENPRDEMTNVASSDGPAAVVAAIDSGWRLAVRSLGRPYRVTIPMVLFVSLVPLYLAIAELARTRVPRVPALALDSWIPLQPAWTIPYQGLYLFLIVLPILIVRQEEHIRRTVRAYLMIWLVSYAIFLVYPTMAPRPAAASLPEGFAVWSLLGLYGADPPYNCFPSLHVAHSFVSALTCTRVHRGLGIIAIVMAAVVALSTLFTKQHYVADLVAGIGLALVAYALFLRDAFREPVSEMDRRAAPALAFGLGAIVCGAVAGLWVVYRVA